MKNKKIQHQALSIKPHAPGQALVTLLVFAAIATTVTSAVVTVSLINYQSTSKYSIGGETLAVAEAGADNAILKLLRNPSYSGSLPTENLTVGSGTATIDVSGSPTVTITSIGTVGNFTKKIQIIGTLANNQFTITSYGQID